MMLHDPLNTELVFMMSNISIRNNIIEKTSKNMVWEPMFDAIHDAHIVVKWINEFILINIYTIRTLNTVLQNGFLYAEFARSLEYIRCKSIVILELVGTCPLALKRRINTIICTVPLKFNVYIIVTNSREETINTISLMTNSIYKMFTNIGEFHLLSGIRPVTGYEVHVKKRKITPEKCFITQLSIIPGISQKKATKIVNVFKTMQSLMSVLTTHSINDIYAYMRNGGIRGIGKQSIRKMVRYLMIQQNIS